MQNWQKMIIFVHSLKTKTFRLPFSPQRIGRKSMLLMNITNFLLSGTLTDFQLKLLELIQYLSAHVDSASSRGHRESAITLQYGYIGSLLGCSPVSLSTGILRLLDLGLLEIISDNYGECALYRYNSSTYDALIKEAKERKVTLISGRKKQLRREVSAQQVLKYMTGKAVAKSKKLHSSPNKPPQSVSKPSDTET